MNISCLSLEDFRKLCRICACPDNTVPFEDGSLVELLRKLMDSESKAADMLPESICEQCLHQLKGVALLRDKCKKSTDFFLKIVIQKEEVIKDEDSVMDNDFQSEYSDCSTHDPVSDSKEDVEYGTRDRAKVKKLLSSKCFACGEKLESGSVFSHYKNHPNCITSDFKCPLCCKAFYQKSRLEAHLRSHEKIYYKCPECKKQYPSTVSLRKHVQQTHQGSKPFICEVCRNGFLKKRSLEEHMNFHTGTTPYVCSYCGKGFKRSSLHAKHVYHSHNIDINKIPFVKRKYVEKRVNLRLECSDCGKIFASRSGFANHQLIHKGIKKFLCNICGKKFISNPALEIHVRSHTGETPFECNECGKSFKERRSLYKHSIQHNSVEKAHYCQPCDKYFKEETLYNKHLELHNSAQPLKCPDCEKVFYTERHLHNHIINHKEKGQVELRTCDICKKSFTESSLKVHMRSHTGEKPCGCNVCGKRLSRPQTLKIHMRQHTGETPFMCAMCEKGFYDSSNLKRHYRRYHGDDKNCKDMSDKKRAQNV